MIKLHDCTCSITESLGVFRCQPILFALESKTREHGNSQSSLNSLQDRKEALIAQLEELNAEMASLKQSIADRKPLLEEAERESKDLQKRYLELSAKVAAGIDP